MDTRSSSDGLRSSNCLWRLLMSASVLYVTAVSFQLKHLPDHIPANPWRPSVFLMNLPSDINPVLCGALKSLDGSQSISIPFNQEYTLGRAVKSCGFSFTDVITFISKSLFYFWPELCYTFLYFFWLLLWSGLGACGLELILGLRDW